MPTALASRLIDKSLFSPPETLETDMKLELINSFWPHLQLSTQDLIEEYYTTFLHFVVQTLRSLRHNGSEFAIKTFDDLFFLLGELRVCRSETRSSMEGILRRNRRFSNNSREAISRSLDLATHLWLGLHVASSTPAFGPMDTRGQRIDWKNNESLDLLVQTQFLSPVERMVDVTSRLDGSFTVVKMKKTRRLDIRWTSNLAEHLKLHGQRGNRVLSIYRHKVCLMNHRDDPQNVIMAVLLIDAIRTLEQLFPFNFETNELLKEHGIVWPDTHGSTSTPDFGYWNERMIELFKLHEGPPETVSQMLLNGKNPEDMVTLWVSIVGLTVVTVLFGIIATVFTVKQYQLALASYDISRESFELSRALACRQSPSLVPEFCGEGS